MVACSGKILSTPTPKLVFRTVMVSRAPPCFRAITTPSKACNRSFVSDSLILTCTRTVSPGWNRGRFFRNWVSSILSNLFISFTPYFERRYVKPISQSKLISINQVCSVAFCSAPHLCANVRSHHDYHSAKRLVLSSLGTLAAACNGGNLIF